MPKIICLVQARMSSTRLPKKVLRTVQGDSILSHIWKRISKSELINEVIIITSEDQSDDIIYDHCNLKSMPVFRGSLLNLLKRHYDAAIKFKGDVVLKIPSDCPLIDPEIIDKVITDFLESEVEYASNLHPMSLPDGMDVEVFSFDALHKALSLADKKEDFEHTTTVMWKTKKFLIKNTFLSQYGEVAQKYRFTLDYEEDWNLIKLIYENLYPNNPNFMLSEILMLMKDNPSFADINKKHLDDIWYLN